MDRGAWWATVHGVAKSQTQLSDFHFSYMCNYKYVLYMHAYVIVLIHYIYIYTHTHIHMCVKCAILQQCLRKQEGEAFHIYL